MEMWIGHDGFSKELVEDVQGQAQLQLQVIQDSHWNLPEGEIVIATLISFAAHPPKVNLGKLLYRLFYLLSSLTNPTLPSVGVPTDISVELAVILTY